MREPLIITFDQLLANCEGTGLKVVDVTQPQRGGTNTVDYTARTVSYQPPEYYGVVDNFKYTIEATGGCQSIAKVTINVPEPTFETPDFVDRWRIRINASTGPESELASEPTICVVQSMNLFSTWTSDGAFGLKNLSVDATGTTPSVDNLPLDEAFDASEYDFSPAYRFSGPAPWYLEANFQSVKFPAITVGRFGGSRDSTDYYTEPGFVFAYGPKAGQVVPIYRTVRQFDVQHYDEVGDIWRTVYRSPTDTGSSSEAGAGQAWEMNTLWPGRIGNEKQLSVPVRSYTLLVTAANAQCEIQRVEFRATPGVPVSPTGGTAMGSDSTNGTIPLDVFEKVGGTPYNMAQPDFGSRYLQYTAATPFVCREVAITASNNPQFMPKRFDILATDAVSQWSYVVHPIYTSQVNWAPGETRVFTFPAVTEPAGLA